MGAFDGLRGDQVAHGYWGPHSGTIDWCETNYSHTRYIAEFVNTLTNLPVIVLGLYGWWYSRKHGIPGRYALCYLGLSLIGVGSFGFHASLRWEWQLMDELPMIYLVSYAAYLGLDTRPSFEPRYGLWGPLLVLAWDVFVTVSYIYLPNPIYHQVAFALILLSSTGRLLLLIQRLPPTHTSKPKIIKTMFTGIATFAGGFGIWNIDNIFCEQLRAIREVLGDHLGMVVQGHGFWHLMTGYGSFLIFVSAIYLQLSVKVSPDAYTFDADSWIPLVRPVTPMDKVKPASVDIVEPQVAAKKAQSGPTAKSVKVTGNGKANGNGENESSEKPRADGGAVTKGNGHATKVAT